MITSIYELLEILNASGQGIHYLEAASSVYSKITGQSKLSQTIEALVSAFPDGPSQEMKDQSGSLKNSRVVPPLSVKQICAHASSLDGDERLAAIRIVISASMADGLVHPEEDCLLQRFLDRMSVEKRTFLAKEILNPLPIGEIISFIDIERHGVFLFTMAVLAVSADKDVRENEKIFIRELADALRLPRHHAITIIRAGLSPSMV